MDRRCHNQICVGCEAFARQTWTVFFCFPLSAACSSYRNRFYLEADTLAIASEWVKAILALMKEEQTVAAENSDKKEKDGVGSSSVASTPSSEASSAASTPANSPPPSMATLSPLSPSTDEAATSEEGMLSPPIAPRRLGLSKTDETRLAKHSEPMPVFNIVGVEGGTIVDHVGMEEPLLIMDNLISNLVIELQQPLAEPFVIFGADCSFSEIVWYPVPIRSTTLNRYIVQLQHLFAQIPLAWEPEFRAILRVWVRGSATPLAQFVSRLPVRINCGSSQLSDLAILELCKRDVSELQKEVPSTFQAFFFKVKDVELRVSTFDVDHSVILPYEGDRLSRVRLIAFGASIHCTDETKDSELMFTLSDSVLAVLSQRLQISVTVAERALIVGLVNDQVVMQAVTIRFVSDLPCRLYQRLASAQQVPKGSTSAVCMISGESPPLWSRVFSEALKQRRVEQIHIRCPQPGASFEIETGIKAASFVIVFSDKQTELQVLVQQRQRGYVEPLPNVLFIGEFDFSEALADDLLRCPMDFDSTVAALMNVLPRCDDKAEAIPMEFARRLAGEYVSALLTQEASLAGKEQSNYVKLCLIGHAAAGKSTAVEMIRTGKIVKEADHVPTHFVTVLETIDMGGCHWIIQDFPGQQEFYGTNLSFMACESALFLAVYDLQNSPEVAQMQLIGWLSSLSLVAHKAFLGSKPRRPKVLLVGTHADKVNAARVDSTKSQWDYLVARFESVEIVDSLIVGCTLEKDPDVLRNAVIKSGKSICAEASPVPKTLLEIRNRITTQRQQLKWVSADMFRTIFTLPVIRKKHDIPEEKFDAPASIASPVERTAGPADPVVVAPDVIAAPVPPPEATVLPVAGKIDDSKAPDDPDIYRMMSLEAMLEVQGDILSLPMGEKKLILLDPQWFAEMTHWVVQPHPRPFCGLETVNGIVEKQALQNALSWSALKIKEIKSADDPSVKTTEILDAVLQAMQVCFQLLSAGPGPVKYLIPSRVELVHLAPGDLELRQSLIAVRLSCPQGYVVPPGLFVTLMCFLRPPFNYSDKPNMFAQREFVVLSKARNKTVIALGPHDSSIDLLADSAQELNRLLLEIHRLQDSTRWELKWSCMRLCTRCVSKWKCTQNGYVRPDVDVCESVSFNVGDRLPMRWKCTRDATDDGKEMVDDIPIGIDDTLQLVVKSTEAELLDHMDDLRFGLQHVDLLLDQLLKQWPSDPTLRVILNSPSLSWLQKKMQLKTWIRDSGVLPDRIASVFSVVNQLPLK